MGRNFPYETRWRETPSGRVAYFDEGQGEALLMIHGLGGDFTHFEHLAPAFAGSRRVIGIDMPGCGASEKTRARHSVGAYARAALELLDALGVERVTLVGHSAGGQVSARIAREAPHRVARMALLNPSGLRGYPAPLRLAARMALRPQVVAPVLKLSARHIMAHVFTRKNEHTERFARAHLEGHRPAGVHDIAKVFHDLGPELLRPEIIESAPHLAMPVLVIWGDQDRLVPLPTVRRGVSALPRGRLEIIAGCGHMPMIEAPDDTSTHLRRFLEESRNP